MDIQSLLGDEADSLLTHVAKGITKDELTLPGPDYIDRTVAISDRSPQVMRNLASMLDHGRLAGTGIRVDPAGRPGHRALGGCELRARTRSYFDPENIVKLAIEGGCNAVAIDVRRARRRWRGATRTRSRSS